MADIKIYKIDKITESYPLPNKNLTYQLKQDLVRNGITQSTVEDIAIKVVKYLLTLKGSDVLDKDYGSYFIGYNNISETYFPILYAEILKDLQSCLFYLRKQGIYLQSINLIDMRYYRNNDPTKLILKIEIKIDSKTTALLDITN